MKTTFKLALLPMLLTASLLLSACQNASSPADSGSETNSSSNNNTVNETDSVVEESAMSSEEKMIDTLSSYYWTLASASSDGNEQPLSELIAIKDQVTLRFNQYQGQNNISYSVGCNTISATFELQGQTMMTKNSMSTKMSCENLNAAENTLNKLMQGNSELSLAQGKPAMLTQVTSDSTKLVWEGRMTAQAKYNSKGETIFWAVEADSKPCTDNSSQQCLQVKPVTYNDQGIKSSEGDVTEFSGTIDGYQHDGKHDSVLRLQRYKLDDGKVAGGDEEYAYVLDTIIETSVKK